MTTIVLDQQTVRRFSGFHGQAEVRDETGRLCGLFIPVESPSPPFEPDFTEEELDLAESEPGGRSLAEILADLKARS